MLAKRTAVTTASFVALSGGVQQNGTASSPPAQSTQPTAPPQNGASGGAAGDVKRPEAAAAAPANSRGGFLKKLLSVLASSHKVRCFDDLNRPFYFLLFPQRMRFANYPECSRHDTVGLASEESRSLRENKEILVA